MSNHVDLRPDNLELQPFQTCTERFQITLKTIGSMIRLNYICSTSTFKAQILLCFAVRSGVVYATFRDKCIERPLNDLERYEVKDVPYLFYKYSECQISLHLAIRWSYGPFWENCTEWPQNDSYLSPKFGVNVVVGLKEKRVVHTDDDHGRPRQDITPCWYRQAEIKSLHWPKLYRTVPRYTLVSTARYHGIRWSLPHGTTV